MIQGEPWVDTKLLIEEGIYQQDLSKTYTENIILLFNSFPLTNNKYHVQPNE